MVFTTISKLYENKNFYKRTKNKNKNNTKYMQLDQENMD